VSLVDASDIPSRSAPAGWSNSLRLSALDHASAGYPVLPLHPGTKEQIGRRLASADLAQVDRWWWEMFPDANVGVCLDGLGVVVLDVDGLPGEESLSGLLARADVVLPDTYEVRTGRGRHCWYRLATGCPILRSQTNGRHGPKLDIKTSGIVVGAWSIHQTGYIYQPNRDRVPTIEQLPELPRPVYDILAVVGHLWEPTKRRSRREVTATASKAPPARRADALDRRNGAANRQSQPGSCQLPTEVRGRHRRKLTDLLTDTSDGRNARSFQAVRLMVWAGCTDEQIHPVLLSSPLGGKAREASSPDRYIQQQIDSARTMVGQVHMPGWDPSAFWVAVRQAGLTSGKTRLLDTMLGHAWHRGVLTKGQAWLGIDSALSPGSVSAHVKSLEPEGWVVVLRPAEPNEMLAATYGLTIPIERQNLTTGLPPAGSRAHPTLTHPLIGVSSTQVLSLDPGHDAFRWAQQSLHSAYPLLCVMGEVPQTTESLAALLNHDVRKVQRDVSALRAAGVVVSSREGHRLVDDVEPRLDEAARRAGTQGTRDAAIEAHLEACARWAVEREEWIRQVRIPGTHQWVKGTGQDYRMLLEDPARLAAMEEAWGSEGDTLDDLVDFLVEAELEHLEAAHRSEAWGDFDFTHDL